MRTFQHLNQLVNYQCGLSGLQITHKWLFFTWTQTHMNQDFDIFPACFEEEGFDLEKSTDDMVK
jgi:hypothetical protein